MSTVQNRNLFEAADHVLHAAVDRAGGVPGVVAMATDRKANIYEGAAGKNDLGAGTPMTTDSVFALFSTTKAVTGTAVMALVEDGKIGLDDAAKAYVPEIADVKVLEGFDASGEPKLRAPKSDVTVRQLLTHTAGFGYDFFNADVGKYMEKTGVPSVVSSTKASLNSVLLFDPGERWEYGSNIDWAGRVAEGASGKRLGELIQERIFDPLEMQDIGFTISAAMRPRRATIHQRGADNSLTPVPELELPQEPEQHMGGHGLYGTVGAYMKFIRMILNDGAAPHGRVLKAETVQTMARDHIGPLKIKGLPGAIPQFTNDAEFFPGMPKSWGLTFMINDEDAPTGRPAGELGWAGLANLFYWIDRKNGVGGFWATQILPFIDSVSFPSYLDFETAVYKSLA
ncbi:MAG: beta-lactamase family protein [Candidatus Eremiobacteraeota bacterium]|nr:beta-lactamase family protein [Candidatus Eremiobacteraeota bacterium]